MLCIILYSGIASGSELIKLLAPCLLAIYYTRMPIEFTLTVSITIYRHIL